MAFTASTVQRYFWVIEQNLFGDRAIANFETRLEAEYHAANLEHEHPLRTYTVSKGLK